MESVTEPDPRKFSDDGVHSFLAMVGKLDSINLPCARYDTKNQAQLVVKLQDIFLMFPVLVLAQKL